MARISFFPCKAVMKISVPFVLRMLLLPALAALTSACAPVGPDYQSPATVMPSAWSEAESPVAPTTDAATLHWWSQFRDPLLDSLIERAAQGNLDLRIAVSRIREARAQRTVAAANGLPAIDATGSYAGSRRSENTGSSGGGTTQDLFTAGFDAGWELDFFGRVRRQVEAAEAAVEASVEDRRDLLVTLTAEVASNYVEVRASQQRLTIARDNIRSQEQTAQLVRGKVDLGLGSDLEVFQTETLLALTRSEAPTLESNGIQAMHRLAVLLGQEPQALKAELAEAAPLPPMPPQLPISLPSDLLRGRPDIRSAERQLAAATATVGATVADLFPRFSLSALVGLQSRSLSDLIASSSHFWTAGPAVHWPLFDGGRTRAGVEISEARLDRARAIYEKTVLTALAEVEDALVTLSRERQKHARLGEAVESARQALTIARGQYKAGLTTFLNVLQSEASLFQSQDKLAQSGQRLAVQTIALYKALGAGWPADPPPPPPRT